MAYHRPTKGRDNCRVVKNYTHTSDSEKYVNYTLQFYRTDLRPIQGQTKYFTFLKNWEFNSEEVKGKHRKTKD